MADKKFDPEKFIDRDFEQELFEELLQLKEPARLLAIKDGGGMGKSQLLQKFQYRCRTAGRPRRTPVSLVDLGQLPDMSSFGLIQQLERDLSAFLKFPTFTQLDAARRDHDFTTIRGAVDLRRANLQQAELQVAGVMTNIEQAGPVTISKTAATFTMEQQTTAQDRCVQAFLQDLTAHCNEQLVVILLDGYEHLLKHGQERNIPLSTWLLEHLLEPYCFDMERRPLHLIIVIAGRELPEFQQHWSRVECDTIVRSVHALGKWKAAHVEECLKVHGFHYTKRQLKLFCDMVEEGFPPSHVIQSMQLLFSTRGKSS